MLNSTFDELQTAVAETTSLASKISNQLETRLQTTEKQLSTILFVITEGIIIVDSDCLIQEWNTGAEIIFGYRKADVIGKHISMLVREEYLAEIKCRFDRSEYSEKGNMSRIRPMKCVTATGEDILVEISINSFPDDGAHGHNMVAIIRDVTEQTQEREARERERKLLAAVLDASADVIMIKDPDGKWLKANKAAWTLYNFTSENDYMHKTDAEIAADFPEHHESLYECIETDDQAWKSHRTTRSEEVIIDNNNQRQYLDILKTPIYADIKHKELLVVSARNITPLKEKREHILVAHKALNAASDMIIITDGEGRILFANKMFMIKYRFVDMQDVLGHRMSIIKSSKTSFETHADLWNTIRSGKTWEGVITNCDTMGNDVLIDSTIIPIVDANLDTPYYICVQKCIDC